MSALPQPQPRPPLVLISETPIADETQAQQSRPVAIAVMRAHLATDDDRSVIDMRAFASAAKGWH